MLRVINIFLFIFCISCAPSAARKFSSQDQTRNLNKGNKSLIWKFAVVSDLNGSYGSTKYSSKVKKAIQFLTKKENSIQFVLSSGDMVAGQKNNLDYEAMWESFHSHVTRPLKASNIPLFPSPGNHDAYIHRKIERSHYKRSWEKEDILGVHPDFQFIKGVSQNYPFYYAFTLGPALFISLDSTSANPYSDKTLEWLESVLESQKDIPHKIIYSHIPLVPFVFKKEREYVAKGDKEFLLRLEELLETYKVSMFLTGHSHAYYPGRRLGVTQFVSVPLLGGGPRELFTKTHNRPRSEHGFLVFEYSKSGQVQMKSLRTRDFSEVEDSEMPSFLDMPSKNIPRKCRGCARFPTSMFVEPRRRILYYRHDL